MVTRKIGKYDILERLGRGGMAEVFRAYHASLDRYVAIKVLHAFLADDPEFKTRFEREARNVARLKHPNIVQVYDFDFDEPSESYYMVMELVEGPTLKERLQGMSEQNSLLPLDESLRIIGEAARALAYAHSRDMIHRDVKPANLMLDHDDRVVLTDFGIAKIVTGAQFTASGGMVGTPAYMAPEQGLGEAGDERSDLYSLGIILFQLATGRLPYDAETPLAIVLKHLQTPTPSARSFNPQVPEGVEQIISRAIAKEAHNRYQSAGELIQDLERIQRGEPVYASNGSNASLLQTSDQDTVRVDLLDDTPTQHLTPMPDAGPPLRKRRPRLGWAVLLVIALAALAYAGAAGGLFAGLVPGGTATPTTQNLVALSSPEVTETTGAAVIPPTNTPTRQPTTPAPSATQPPTARPTTAPSGTRQPTLMPSRTPAPSSTPTATLTRTPTATHTPTETFTPTPDASATAAAIASIQTATATACIFNYEIVDQDPADNGLFPANRDYARKITLRNTGSCGWEPNTSLFYVRGESFSAGTLIRIEKPVPVDETVVLDFVGKTPARGAVYTGTWELRTPNNQRRIGEPLNISVTVYEGGQ